MFAGVLYGLSACALWGLTYLLPVLLPEYDALYIAIARAFVMGLVSLVLIIVFFPKFRSITKQDWIFAVKLTLIGNLIQAWFLMLSVEYAGVPVAGICFGAVPVLVALISNERSRRKGKPFVHLKALVIPLLCIFVGFVMINFTELEEFLANNSGTSGTFFLGLGCGLISTLMWTWYPIRNADWLLDHPKVDPTIWTCAQCVVLCPISAVLYCVVYAFDPEMPSLLGPTPVRYFVIMLFAGVCCSWLATALWNMCSAKLPTALVGQLLVFETIFSVVYGHIFRMQWPTITLSIGFCLLIAGISVAVRIFNKVQAQS
ncbi:MAG TPA: DMT family transporter [Candidatus Aphodousia gallistercoris]|nr:DMT family transporter [Candidatus Aphodousia gallistercoris]